MEWLFPAAGFLLGLWVIYLGWSVASFVNAGTVEDDQKFEQYGVDPLSAEALPYYARWVRQDVVGLFYLVSRATMIIGVLLIVIAIPLWMIALR